MSHGLSVVCGTIDDMYIVVMTCAYEECRVIWVGFNFNGIHLLRKLGGLDGIRLGRNFHDSCGWTRVSTRLGDCVSSKILFPNL